MTRKDLVTVQKIVTAFKQSAYSPGQTIEIPSYYESKAQSLQCHGVTSLIID